MKKVVSFVLLLCLVCSVQVSAYQAKAYILMDRQTKTVLVGNNENERLPMASTTKIMTAIVALELANLDDWYTIPKEAEGIEGSSIYLKEGETYRVIDLLYGLMIRSGNDAAVALAIYTAGSLEHFVHLMNRKADSIGATNTSFANPHGLDADNHYTTAYDLALITAYAMDNPIFREIASSKHHRVTTKEGEVKEYIANNKFLLNYPHASASKTGWTTPSGRCLSAVGTKDYMEFVTVFLCSPDWFNNAMKLTDWAFENYELIPVAEKDSVIDNIEVKDGAFPMLPMVSKEEVFLPVKKGMTPQISSEIHKLDLSAPIARGQKVGEIVYYADGQKFYTMDLLAGAKVEKKPLPWYKRILSPLSLFVRRALANG